MGIGRQLGQLRPANTTAASVYSPVAGQKTEIKSIFVCNQTGNTPTFQIFHDEDGTTYDETTALYFNVAMAANTTTKLDDIHIWMHNSAGNIGVRTSANNELTFTVYGIEHDMVA